MPTSKIQRYFRHGMLVQLRVFEAVARLGSFTRAGEEAHMAQPTVSSHMKKLSETIGTTLVEHVGKRVRLTPAGEELHSACRRIFGVLTDFDQALTDLKGLRTGKLRIATTTSGEYLLPQLLAAFVRRHPGIDVSLHVNSREAMLARFNEVSLTDDKVLPSEVKFGDISLLKRQMTQDTEKARAALAAYQGPPPGAVPPPLKLPEDRFIRPDPYERALRPRPHPPG